MVVSRFKYLIFAVISMLLPMYALANNPRLLIFDEPVMDLGIIKEVDGAVKLSFKYTNITDEFVVILGINTQCGCAHPEFSTKPIKPAGEGIVEVIFDPKDRFGDFEIGLTVIASNGDYKKFNTLVVKGIVINRIPEVEIKYPYALSPIMRADNKTIGMRQIEKGDRRVRILKMFNTSSESVNLSFQVESKNLKISGPTYIDAKEEAELEYTLDTLDMLPGEFVIKSIIRAGKENLTVEIKGVVVEESIN